MALTLEIENLRIGYEGRSILSGASCRFDQPGIHVLMGENGSGKSTLLRICALLEQPDDGRVIYRDGAAVLAADIVLRRRITLVLPRVGLFNETVYENAAYGLKVRGVAQNEVSRCVHQYLALAGLDGKARQNALTLSSGEIQRLGLARALVIQPEVLYLDEPTAFIDAHNRAIIENVLLDLKRESRTIVVMTTHDRAQAERLADRVFILADGLIGSRI